MIQQGPLKLLFSFLGPKDSFIPDPEIIKKMGKRAPYLSGYFLLNAAAAAASLQSCPTLCDPIDGSPRGSPVPGILQARTLEWVAMSFSNA